MDFEKRRRQFAELVDLHGASLMGMLRRMTRNHDDADEVFQETALRAWKHLRQAPTIRSPRAWLMKIGYHACLDFLSRRTRDDPLEAECPDDRHNRPDVEAERSEAADRVNAFVMGLPDSVRDVVLLHYSGGLSLRETAATIGVPIGTAKSRLNQALALLRKKM